MCVSIDTHTHIAIYGATIDTVLVDMVKYSSDNYCAIYWFLSCSDRNVC